MIIEYRESPLYRSQPNIGNMESHVITTFLISNPIILLEIFLLLATNYNWELQQSDVKMHFWLRTRGRNLYGGLTRLWDKMAARTVYRRKSRTTLSNHDMHGLENLWESWWLWDTNKAKGTILSSSNTHFWRTVTPLIVSLDEIIVTGDDEKKREFPNQFLAKEFEIKELRSSNDFLGIKATHST